MNYHNFGVNFKGFYIMVNKKSKVYLIKTDDRSYGIDNLTEQFNLNSLSGKDMAIKANFNSADPFPASTHIETLKQIIKNLNKKGINDITLAERSGMGNTENVLNKMGVFDLADEMSIKIIVLDKMERDGWVKIENDGTHWFRGFYMPKLIMEASSIIQTCCLKTHRFGGHFTLSMKNSVGLVSKRLPGGIYNFMAELHMSPNQRKMIAEINKYYKVDMVIMDAIKAFISKGPETGDTVEPNLLLASNDRVAIDAVGVAILRNYGSKTNINNGKIFDQDQIKRAVELEIGVTSVDDIELVPLNDQSHEDVDRIMKLFEAE